MKKHTLKNAVLAAVALSALAPGARAELIHRYGFNDATDSTTISDSVGTAHGTISGGVTLDGSQAFLDGVDGYIDLPNGIVSGLTNITIESWITWNGGGTWQRIFDFGTSSNGEGQSGTGQRYLFVSPRGGANVARFVITGGSGGEERPVLDGPSAIPEDGSPVHVAVTYGPGVARLFINGRQVASGAYDTPLSAVEDVNVWLGRSNWPDPYFSGTFNEFRIHNNILTGPQIGASAQGSPDSLNYEPGTLTSLTLGVDPAMIVTGQQQPVIAGVYSIAGEVSLAPSDGLVLTSSNTNAVAVLADGTLSAVGTGSATITASLGGRQATASISVESSRPELKHRYSFSEAAGASETVDSIGAQNGAVIAAAEGTNTVVLGGGRAVFPGGAGYRNGGYVDLPNGLISSKTNITIETWVTWNGPSATQWQRIFDFGDSQKGEDAHAAGNGLAYLFLTPRGGGGVVRFAGKPDANTGEAPVLDGRATLPVGQEAHVVVVYSPAGRRSALYVNGVRVATGTAPFALSSVNDVNNWLGLAQWNDPPFNGAINEFRIWEGGFSDIEVALSRAAGPDTVRSSPGALRSIAVTVPPVLLGNPAAAVPVVLADFESATGIDISAVAGVAFSSSDTNVFTVNATGGITAVAAGTANLNVTFQNQSKSVPVTVLAPMSLRFGTGSFTAGGMPARVDLRADFSATVTNIVVADYPGVVYGGGSASVATLATNGIVTPAEPGVVPVTASFRGLNASGNVTVVAAPGSYAPRLVHRYSFSETSGATQAVDSVGGANGELVGGASAEGTFLRLNGTDGYVNLPNGIISALTNTTIETWVTWTGPQTQQWSRIFDFGTSVEGEDLTGTGSSFIFFTPRGGSSLARVGFNPANGSPQFDLDAPVSLTSGQAVHVAVAYDVPAGVARIYLNGVRVATGVTTTPLTVINDNNNWIGRSQYNDPYFTGDYDEFRIYDGALSDVAVAASFAAGPDNLPSAPRPTLTATRRGDVLVLSWPASATGYAPQTSATLGGAWTPVSQTPVVQDGTATVEITPTATGFYRLSR
jgi:hypothetical protein